MIKKSKLEDQIEGVSSYSEELSLNLTKPNDRFLWFLASILFSNRISADIALKTIKRFEEEELSTPDKILEAGWDHLVQVLDSGGYTRYDFSTATYLLDTMEKLKKEYGNLDEVHRQAEDPGDLENKLKEFKGLGPTGVNIFLRELRGTWEKAQHVPSKYAVEVAEKVGIKDVKKFESKLVRIYIDYCKKEKCENCPLKEYCKKD